MFSHLNNFPAGKIDAIWVYIVEQAAAACPCKFCTLCFVLIFWSVPIYDAQQHLFDYANDLEHVDSVLPRFDGEIPASSFAIVAYTMSTYKKAANHHLSTNVQFVILLKEYK